MDGAKKTILLSAGGTGGHMSPASALATELRKAGHRVVLATDVRGERHRAMFPDMDIHILQAGTAGAGVVGKVRGMIRLARGTVLQGFSLIHRLKPDTVVGFSGYPSVPAVLAAQMRGVPTGLHEQNAIIGKANRFLAPKARFIGLSLPLSQDEKRKIRDKAVLTGNPVRPEVIALRDMPYPPLPSGEDGEIHIFVMGGSLGAAVFADVVPEALMLLPDAYRKRLRIVQQCRQDDIERAEQRYAQAEMPVVLAPFFDDVAAQLGQAHLFIGRSGASTVAEISVAGRPAIYVPYPHHKDQQQKRNAQDVAEKGGAWIVSEAQFTPQALAERLQMLFKNPETLQRAAMRAKECGVPDAAQRLARLVLSHI